MRSLLSDEDLYLFNEGTHERLFEHLGAHSVSPDRGGPLGARAPPSPSGRPTPTRSR